MRYSSTRGGEAGLSFRDVLFSGYAKDKGLYVPEKIPHLSPEDLKVLAPLPYPGLVFEVCRRFIAEKEIPSDELRDLITSSLSRFSVAGVVRIKRLSAALNIAELFHGPTLAFKDLALSVVSALLNYYLRQSKERITILVGTSGDTGSAAIESVRGATNSDIIVLLPHGHCTHTQELQMTTVIADNVHVYCVEGTSDELDKPIKRCFKDPAYVSTHNLVSINSINWGRILVQIAHYFYCYYQLCESVGQLVEIVVPSGAAGNITAGCIAQQMGLPIKLISAVNKNDIVARTLSSGDMSIRGEVVKSIAPAMDIQMAYNLERLLHLFSGGSGAQVRGIMEEFERERRVRLSEDIMNTLKEVVIDTYVADDGKIKAAMRRVYEENDYVVCPHTAIAASYHYHRTPRFSPRVCLATAAPDKFPEAVIDARIDIQMEGLRHLSALPTRCAWMRQGEDWDKILRDKIEEITDKRKEE